MNVVEFVKEAAPADGVSSRFAVNIRIDGRLLAEIMRDVEAPMAANERHPEIAGGYSAIGRPDDPEGHYLGQHRQKWGESKEKTLLLDCECGCPGCWPLLCRIEIANDEVKWREFEQPHRGRNSKASFWDYSSFEGFTFSKEQYLSALLRMCRDA